MTPKLLGELLTDCGNFRILGNLRRAYVPIPNKFGIESFEDLLYVILGAHHHGAENLKALCAELALWKISDKVTKGMLDNSEKVCIIDAEIMLTRLARATA